MPKIGETVRYGQSGLCKIEGTCEKEIAGVLQEYFMLTPLFKKGSTVCVPCGNEELLQKMCPPLTEEEIPALLARAAEAETEWIRDFRRRSGENLPQRNLLLRNRHASVRVLFRPRSVHQHHRSRRSDPRQHVRLQR